MRQFTCGSQNKLILRVFERTKMKEYENVKVMRQSELMGLLSGSVLHILMGKYVYDLDLVLLGAMRWNTTFGWMWM